jgi:YebC/PmpR family DNA-binding regulatory protein
MSGHNKWSKIKHKKAATDSARSKIYSKYNKLIQVAVKNAGGDLNSASVLNVIENAKKENVPKDNIDRAIKKATGSDAENLQEVMYECFGPAGVGILIKAITDNTNRTVTEIKTICSKNGASFATSGAVSWAFNMNEDRE